MYHTPKHLLIVLVFVTLPFIFLFFFSRAANITIGELVTDVLFSFARLFIAYIIAAILGWVCAALFYKEKSAKVALPIFDVLQSVPTFAALPIAVAYLGVSNFTVILFLTLAIVWPIFFSIISSLKMIRHDWEEAIEITGIKGWDYLKYFLWPASTAGLITGSIIGLGDGYEALVVTEIVVGLKKGLGSFFQNFSTNTTITIFGILGFLIIIFAINRVIWLPLLEKSHKQMEE